MPAATPNVVILDNGASTVKAGVLGVHDEQPRFVTSYLSGLASLTDSRIIPNAVVRVKADNATYIGHELAKCRDFTSLRFRLPFEKVGLKRQILQRRDENTTAVRAFLLTGMLKRPFGMGSSRVKCWRSVHHC